MATLNIKCSICFEFYKESDHIMSTSCGHLFHDRCLFASLARAKSCPECRRPCNKHTVHPVYLNYGERTATDDEWDAQLSTMVNIPIWTPLYRLEMQSETGVPQPEPEPDEAIKAGTDTEGNPTFVARVYYHDDLLPAAYVPQKGFAYASHGCNGHALRNGVELLCNLQHKWMPDSNGHVPENAIETGYSELGETLYTARAQYEGLTLLGKVHPSHRVMYMPYNGQEVNTTEYEVLVVDKTPETN